MSVQTFSVVKTSDDASLAAEKVRWPNLVLFGPMETDQAHINMNASRLRVYEHDKDWYLLCVSMTPFVFLGLTQWRKYSTKWILFFPNKLSLFVNSWFYIVVRRNHAVKLFMANTNNKDIPHHRSHTELNKHKHQAFLPLHFTPRFYTSTYIHKLIWNLAWNTFCFSFYFFVACFSSPNWESSGFNWQKKVEVVTVEQGTQLYFIDLKPYFVLHTCLNTNPKPQRHC